MTNWFSTLTTGPQATDAWLIVGIVVAAVVIALALFSRPDDSTDY